MTNLARKEMILITRKELKEEIMDAISVFKRDCNFILNYSKTSNESRMNVLDKNKEAAITKIITIVSLSDYDEEIMEFGLCNIEVIHSMYNYVFDEIIYKYK